MDTLLETYATLSPDGQEIQIPVSVHSASDPYLQLNTPEAQKAYYEKHGYIVLRKLIPETVCNRIHEAFQKEVKPFEGYIYRQTSSLPEKHVFTENGYILNSIKHIQDMNPKTFPDFIQASFQAIGHAHVLKAVENLLGESSVIVQTMFFEGNPSTPAHYDSYYLDSAEIGAMTAAWIALEDIKPGAGRFFVYPDSHRSALPQNDGDYEISFHHDQYLAAIQACVSKPEMHCWTPALEKGDVLFWNAKTIHGSLATTQPEFSRTSLTAHFIPASKDYCLFQKLKIKLNLKEIHLEDGRSLRLHSPKDQRLLINRIQMFCLQRFPKITNLMRNCLIRLRTQG